MSVTKRKKSRTKKNNQPILNYLLSVGLIIIMILMSLPKIVMAQLMPDNQQRVTGIPNATIKLPNTEYTESTVDLRVKVLGGEIKLKRTWVNGRWYINPAWAELRFIADPLDDSIQAIDRAGIIYQRTGDANLYSFNQVYLKKTDTGWQWYDRQGNCINYDQAGRITQYRDQNNITVNFVLDNQGRRTAIKDHNNELVYSFTYDNQERLTQIKDRENRTVTYQWQGNLLTQVTDVLGNQWHYGYDSQGQLNQRTEPDGGIIKLDYTESVVAPHPAMVSGKDAGKIQQSSVITLGASNKDTKVARVGKITDKTGAITLWDLQYNRTTKQYTITTDDPQGKKTIAVFDKDGQRLSTKINGQLQQTILRDTANNIVKTIDQRGQTTTVAYNQQHQPLKITYPNGAAATLQYNNPLNKITSYTDVLGNTTTWQYDDHGNPIKIIEALDKPEQRIISLSYNNYGQATQINLGQGNTAITYQQTYDNQGNIATVTDGNGHTYHYHYNLQGQITQLTNPLNANWQITYNLAGHPTKAIDPLNQTTTYTTDAMGRVTQSNNPLGYQTNYQYQFNNQGWQITKTNALNQTTTYQYDPLARLTKVTSPSGLAITQNFDNFGRIKQQTDTAGNQYTTEYGKQGSGLEGLVVKALYPTFTETYQYNALGLPTTITQILDAKTNLTTRISYDQQGQLISQTDPANRTSQLQYNPLGYQQTHIDPQGNQTAQTWDLLGNVTSVKDAKGNLYHYQYDKNGNLIQETKALGNDITYRYDQANQLIQQQDASGNITNYQYDLAGRVITQSYNQTGQTTPSQTITYRYNQANDLIEVTQSGDTNSHFIYQTDPLGRVTKATITYGTGSTSIAKTLQYTYDLDGNLATTTYPDNSLVTYSYDKDQLKQTLLPNGEKITWDKYQWNQPTQISYPNVTETHTYDALQKPLTIQVKDNNHQLLMDRSYQYDKAENITKRSSEEGTTQYTYDLLDRLTTAIPSQSLQQKGLPIESYSYDAIANRTGSAHQPGDWQYNDKNQLTQWGNGNQQKTLTYTPNGHIATEKQANKILSYNYNAADRLTSIKNGTTQIASYQYDPYGRRISKTVNGTTTYYLYTAEGLLAELDQQGNLQVAYGWAPDTEFGTTPLWQANLTAGATLKTAQYNYLHTDHLGTVQLATDSTGQVTWKAVAEAFGKTILDPTNKITINLRFPGQYYDQETGTHYNYFRDYNPNLGRYNESDPIGLDGGINSFAYAYNNPLKWQDSYGLETQVTCYGFACIITFTPLPPTFDIHTGGSPFADDLGGLGGFPASHGIPGPSSSFPSFEKICEDVILPALTPPIASWIIYASSSNDSQDNGEKKPSDLNKIEEKQLENIIRNYDTTVHDFKKEYGTDSRFDAYYDKKTGKIWLFKKGGKGPGIPTDYKI